VGGVLITGATGFLGRHVVVGGQKRGAELHTLGRDIANAAHVRNAVSRLRPKGIIHLAAAGVAQEETDTASLLRTNALGLAHLLEAAAELPAPPPVVCAGSGFEYAPLDCARRENDPVAPNTPYGASKAAGTAVASVFAGRLPITVLRLFSLYGPGEAAGRLAPYVIAKARAGEPADLTPGKQLRDYAEVGDVAEAFWRALDQPPTNGKLRLLNVGTGKPVALRDFCEILATILREAGCAPDLRFGTRPYRPDEMMNYTADVGLLESTLRWMPATSLESGLRRMVYASCRE
jgi:nucleoside-diphosphate-sugar epimerase